MSNNDDYLLLKWGSLKGWCLESDANAPALAKLHEYEELGCSMSAMAQRDSPEQKQLLCEAIDLFRGPISNDWDGNSYTKEQAKHYIMNYGKRD